MWIRKGKLCGRILKACQVQNKPNLDNILKSYLSYCDLKSFHNSHDYFERLQKNLFAMIQQLGPSMFFITFTSTERFWDPFIKTLHTLHASKLNFPNIKDLKCYRSATWSPTNHIWTLIAKK